MKIEQSENPIKVSVIIPCRNGKDVLRRVLERLGEQDFRDFEAIIIDDGSKDGTLAWLQSFIPKLSFRCQLLQTAGVGAAGARNLGVKHAQGILLVFLDADTIPNKDLLRRHWEVHQQRSHETVCIMGKLVMPAELKRPDQIRWHEHDLPCPSHGVLKVEHLKYRTSNSSISLRLFQETGGFHPGLIASEDLEFAFRLADRGVEFYYYDDIVAEHYHPINLKQYIEKGRIYGQAVAYWYRTSPHLHVQLARRYGLYHPALSFATKLRYLLKRLTVNGCTVPLLTLLAGWLRRKWFSVSDRMYKAIFGYYLRQQFRISFHTSGCVLGIYC